MSNYEIKYSNNHRRFYYYYNGRALEDMSRQDLLDIHMSEANRQEQEQKESSNG